MLELVKLIIQVMAVIAMFGMVLGLIALFAAVGWIIAICLIVGTVLCVVVYSIYLWIKDKFRRTRSKRQSNQVPR